MLIADMSNELIRAEMQKLRPMMVEGQLASHRWYDDISHEAGRKKRECDKWRYGLLMAYYFELNGELERREKSKRNWRKWFSEYSKLIKKDE
jgi:hypothetical protein